MAAAVLQPSLRVQEALGDAQSAIAAALTHQLGLLQETRSQHSHSDLLLPPDLTKAVLAAGTLKLKQDIDDIVSAALPAHDEPLAESSKDAAQTANASALRGLVQTDLFGLLARQAVSADALDHINSTEAPRPQYAKALYDRLDVILSFEVHDLVDNGLALTIHHEVLDRLSVSACSQHFDYIESRIKDLTRGLVPGKGKGLVLLRLCNELLRRLSKPSSSHTVFAGRILSLLSSVFPLGERSGVNLRGDFNVDNRTIFDSSANDQGEADSGTSQIIEGSEKGEDAPAISQVGSREAAYESRKQKDEMMLRYARTHEFYVSFWGAQQWFGNPAILVDERVPTTSEMILSEDVSDPSPEGGRGRMKMFRRATRRILDVFGAVQRRERELAGQAAAEERMAGPRLQKEDNRHLPTAGDELLGKGVGRSEENSLAKAKVNESDQALSEGFFPKYLTGKNLLEYELRDATFRRHILVQYLILFQYLLSFSTANKEKQKAWKNVVLAQKVSSTLDESDDRWIKDTWREVLHLIRDTSAEGHSYASAVLRILSHEGRWIDWKAQSGPSIERPAMTEAQRQNFVDARKAHNRPLRPYPFALGTAALSRLWEDGVRPPEPSMRTMEDENGDEIKVQTDGLDELEIGPQIPSLESYAHQIRSIEERQSKRRREIDLAEPRRYIIHKVVPPAIRREERERVVREAADPQLAELEHQRAVAAWRALRLARSEHMDLFGKIQCESTALGGGVAVGMRIDDVTGLMESVEKKEKGIPILPTAPLAVQKKENGAKEVKGEAKIDAEDDKATHVDSSVAESAEAIGAAVKRDEEVDEAEREGRETSDTTPVDEKVQASPQAAAAAERLAKEESAPQDTVMGEAE